MARTKIDKLTPEQESLIPVTLEKWRASALQTEPIERQKASEAVKAAYNAIDQKEPKILFFDNPYFSWKDISGALDSSNLESQLWNQLVNPLMRQLTSQLETPLVRELRSQLERQLLKQLSIRLGGLPYSKLGMNVLFRAGMQRTGSTFFDSIQPELWVCSGSWFDFCFSVLNCALDQTKWEAFQSLVSECGWLFPFEEIAIICNRPIKLSFDNENRLHAEAAPAIKFADGFSVYAYHGVTLPKKYGELHPHQWQAQWLLEEDNAELRQVLIQGIGYARMCQELQAIELDSWQEYTLLRIDNKVDVEPIYLLKMTCPSTKFIHALRVPPDMKSAREAIRWVNWDIDPEKFSVQT